MKNYYFKDHNGTKVNIEVADDIAYALEVLRRAEWRNDAMEKYYRENRLSGYNDKDAELGSNQFNPEVILLEREYQTELRHNLAMVFKSLTKEQIRLVTMLNNGISITKISDKLCVGKSAVSHMRKRIQEKIKKFLKNPSTKCPFFSAI